MYRVYTSVLTLHELFYIHCKDTLIKALLSVIMKLKTVVEAVMTSLDFSFSLGGSGTESSITEATTGPLYQPQIIMDDNDDDDDE
jgi:hypothetical protein